MFEVIAEPNRRVILDLLREGELPVSDLVDALGLSQPAVSKHLGVLRKVGLVSVSKQGQQRLYQLEADRLKAVHDWAKKFEKHWTHQLDRIKQRAERLARDERS